MARQVAHEIKNPLTPIQLSAEHLRRVHADRGEPLGAVLESCVDVDPRQVRLLRQISAEFSSFASSPTARRAPVDVPELVADVVDPYRTGLAGRIDDRQRVAAAAAAGASSTARSIARALANIVENALHAMPGAGALTIDARAPTAAYVTIAGRGHRRRDGRGGAGARLRAVLLDQDHRHRPGPADRAAQHRVERRHDRGRERRRARGRSSRFRLPLVAADSSTAS